MLQLDVALCLIARNVAHSEETSDTCLRAPACRIRDADRNTHRQARPDATTFLRSSGGCNKHQTEYYTPQGVYLRRWLGLGPDVKGAPPRPGSRAIVVFTQRRNLIPLAKLLCPVPANGGWRLRRIPTFLPEASFKV